MVCASSVRARVEKSRVICRMRSSSSGVNSRPQNDKPPPMVTGMIFTCGWQALMLTLYKCLGNVQRNLYGLAALGLGLPLYDTKGQSPDVGQEAYMTYTALLEGR